MDPYSTLLKMIFDRWNASIANCTTLLNSLTDEQVQKEVAPGKNRGSYILGHLIAVHDDMLVLLDMGEKLYPEMHRVYIATPDKAGEELLTVQELRQRWSTHCETLKQKFDALKPEEWLNRHTAVAPDDFSKEPYRNKLNIIVTRTTHLAYHTGQLALLK
ncbi:MAG: DinB family protein [Chitinophagales bacterium]